MPWWLLGVSMVATTFSTDTPNLVTDLVRQNGVSGNWAWWAFLLTGMLTVFVYAKLWHRSGVLTDIEFYELRYSGKAAAFLRGFRALYLGLVFNVLVMGAVSLAAIKFGEIVLGLPGWVTLTIACSITLAYSTLGGLKAVIITDFVQFTLAMIGSIWGMMYILGLPQIGGLSNLLQHSNVVDKLALIPDISDPNVWVTPDQSLVAEAISPSACFQLKMNPMPLVQPFYSMPLIMPCAPGPGYSSPWHRW